MDESGTSSIPGNTSHFVLAGLSIPIDRWRVYDRQISEIKSAYGLENAEIHTAWMLRKYLEQSQLSGFHTLSREDRREAVMRYRKGELLRKQRGNIKAYRQTKKNFAHTEEYVHLTLAERRNLVKEIAHAIAGWEHARLFAECIDKVHFSPDKAGKSVDEQAFEQIVSRFEQYLKNTESSDGPTNYGLLIHDNNQTVAKRHTELMLHFHDAGTLWTSVERIIETPLFVDSALTSMVQLADVCSYALRRYLEKGETGLFNPIFRIADTTPSGVVVGVRHFGERACTCRICTAHRPR